MAHNCLSLPPHLSASRLLNGIRINQWALVSAALLLLLLLLQLERKWRAVAAATALRRQRWWCGLRSGLGPPPGAAVMTPYNPNGLLHAALT